MRKGSIAVFLFWLSAAWLILALVATGFLLSDLYSRALDTSLSDTLDFHVESLTGALLETGDPLSEAISLNDPRFERPRSGWYWAIRDADGTLYNLSTSVVGINLPKMMGPVDEVGRRTAVVADAFGTQLRVLERTVTVSGRSYQIVVTGNLSEILLLVDDFRGQALIVLGAVAVMLAIMSALVTRFAMRPIARLSAAIERVRDGDQVNIGGTYPREIAPLAEEVNELLRSNTQIIERARSQVGNLAHGLKTPLAVLRNEAGTTEGPLAGVVLAETEKMSGIVATYLDRARLAARTAVVGKRADAGQSLAGLVRVMRKLHAEVELSFEAPEAGKLWFRGDEADLEEMAGNLLDNACKWSRSTVRVTLSTEPGESGSLVVIRIEDDGPGLSAEEAQKVLRRGVRLDEKTPGSGLGLDIVKELVDVYGGTLSLGPSSLGGLRAELRLPAARAATAPRN